MFGTYGTEHPATAAPLSRTSLSPKIPFSALCSRLLSQFPFNVVNGLLNGSQRQGIVSKCHIESFFQCLDRLFGDRAEDSA